MRPRWQASPYGATQDTESTHASWASRTGSRAPKTPEPPAALAQTEPYCMSTGHGGQPSNTCWSTHGAHDHSTREHAGKHRTGPVSRVIETPTAQAPSPDTARRPGPVTALSQHMANIPLGERRGPPSPSAPFAWPRAGRECLPVVPGDKGSEFPAG